MIQFDMPRQPSSIIKVIGVGGGGSNAVNHMHNLGMEGVDFVICNTDAQALKASKVPHKIQLGPGLTQGLGAGMNPAIGRQATEESLEEIRQLLEGNTKMAFITAGMGGGTGTGGAPVVARLCRELGILTVGIVTMPFSYEMKKRMQQAEEGIAGMRQYVDTLLIISNDKLRHQFGSLTFKAAFSTADNVLATATRCITEVISNRGHINVDFADVCTVMRNGGMAILGSARAEGDDRALRAIEQAIHSPLLNENDIHGAKWVLININSSEGDYEFTVDEVETIQQYLQTHAGRDYDLFMGLGYDNSLGAQIGITIIATGFHGTVSTDSDLPASQTASNSPTEEAPVILQLGDPVEAPSPEQMHPAAPSIPQSAEDFMPTLVEWTPYPATEMPSSLKWRKEEISAHTSTAQPSLVRQTVFDLDGSLVSPAEKTALSEDAILPASEGFLAKPAQIYVEREEQPAVALVTPQTTDLTAESQVQEPEAEMRLVIREHPVVDSYLDATTPSSNVSGNLTKSDETEELKRQKALRESKLRNLSFKNMGLADAKNEIEYIPAFIRRGTQDRGSQSAGQEQIYSQLTVKADEEKEKIYLSSLNTFLDGKKPD